ncbi:hypothetical protein [Cohnella cholangitidis]|uniref:Uncharacterized protein n=1 Tax=Cohnella cholangitidis TaxID=2598458 RepID=A0A7G5BVX1_9BACL|nr:hypothetical protein [Cohnella cholangitidis]QMV41105.1 hypothetical protein FPL14_07775 [Cohnella cholangitidis]
MSATIRAKEVSDSEKGRKGLTSLSAQAREIGKGTVSKPASIVYQRKKMGAAPNLFGFRRTETSAQPLKAERNKVQAGDSQVARGKMKSSGTQAPMTNRMPRGRGQAQQPLSVNYIQATVGTRKSMPTLIRKPEQVVSASSIVGSFELRTPFVQAQSQRGESPSRNSGKAGQWVENDKQAAPTRSNMTARRQATQAYSIPSTSAVPTIGTTMRRLPTLSAARNIFPATSRNRLPTLSQDSTPFTSDQPNPSNHSLSHVTSSVAGTSREQTSSIYANEVASAEPANAASLELRRNVREPAAPEKTASHVEAAPTPPEINVEQLQKAISSMPQLNPDELADQVYKSLMKRMKFEQRLRGY